SCAEVWQPSHVATWWRCAADQPSVNSSIRAASGRAAAESSNKSRNFAHSSLFFFSRFHIPASLPLLLSTSISALLCLTYHPAPGGKSGDRKSTRLNSSHLGISYAVFCLKK